MKKSDIVVSVIPDRSQNLKTRKEIPAELATVLSFNCHDIADELKHKFGIRINKYGLIDEQEDWQAITDYMNDEATPTEPVPWYVCKVKMTVE